MMISLIALGSFIAGVATTIGLLYLATESHEPRRRNPRRTAFYQALNNRERP